MLQTPLFRVRNKKKTFYCYDEMEKQAALNELGARAEITRFKGLGEISPDEFSHFIGEDIRPIPWSSERSKAFRKCLASSWARTRPTAKNSSLKTSAWRKTK